MGDDREWHYGIDGMQTTLTGDPNIPETGFVARCISPEEQEMMMRILMAKYGIPFPEENEP